MKIWKSFNFLPKICKISNSLQNLIMKLLIDFDHKKIIILKIFFRIYFHLPSTFLLLEQISGVLMICSFEISWNFYYFLKRKIKGHQRQLLFKIAKYLFIYFSNSKHNYNFTIMLRLTCSDPKHLFLSKKFWFC